MIFGIISILMLGAIGLILVDSGLDIATWQYWVIMILAGIGIPVMDALHDDYKNK